MDFPKSGVCTCFPIACSACFNSAVKDVLAFISLVVLLSPGSFYEFCGDDETANCTVWMLLISA